MGQGKPTRMFAVMVGVLILATPVLAETTGEPCGDVTYEGCCAEGIVFFCADPGELNYLDCTQSGSESCGWNSTGGYYDCQTAGMPDPTGTYSMDCGGGGTPTGQPCGNVSYSGCCQGQQLLFCEDNELMTIDCTEAPSCGWNLEDGYYDCQTSGMSDPSGMNPISCDTGTNPSPVCGNGACEVGETEYSCPADCSSGCVPQCDGKDCGDDGCQGTCGTCPVGYFCTYNGICQSNEPCVPDCTGRQCGDDGCGGSCGSCPGSLECVAGMCTPEGTDDPTDPEACVPQCEGRACGPDGCGGMCDTCPNGFDCNEQGMCIEMPMDSPEVPPTDYQCDEGQTLMYGKCVDVSPVEEDAAQGCSGAPGPVVPMHFAWFLLLLLVGFFRVVRIRD